MQSKRGEQSLVVGGSMVYFEETKEMTGKNDWPGQSTGCAVDRGHGCAVDRGHSWAEEGMQGANIQPCSNCQATAS